MSKNKKRIVAINIGKHGKKTIIKDTETGKLYEVDFLSTMINAIDLTKCKHLHEVTAAMEVR